MGGAGEQLLTGLLDPALVLGVFILPIPVLAFVPPWFRKHANDKMVWPLALLAILGGMTWFETCVFFVSTQNSFHRPSYITLAYAVIGCAELFYLLGWLFWERGSGMSPRRRHSLMGLIYLVVAGSIVWGFLAYRQKVLYYPPYRAMAARAMSDMRILSIVLNAYRVDNDAYPPAVNETGSIIPLDTEDSGISSGFLPWLLTTPTAYIAQLPTDPFFDLRSQTPVPFRYAPNGANRWILGSRGPDNDTDTVPEDFFSPDRGDGNKRIYLRNFAVEWDPSNGIMSSGDILRTGP